jgi:hypothetical protein
MPDSYILVDSRIHFRIFFKKIVRIFLKKFGQKCFKDQRFKELFSLRKDFHLTKKEDIV